VKRERRALYSEAKMVRGATREKYSQIDVTIIFRPAKLDYDTGAFESVANRVFACHTFETE